MNPSQVRAYLRDLERFGIKLGLGNIRILLAALGDPHRAFPSVHVAGTNGKGSVCAMLSGILSRCGLRVGLYTSPHLVRLEERIRVGERTVPSAALARHISLLRETIDRLRKEGGIEAHPTFFEVLTAAAFLHFRDRKVDVAVLETGMGGRFDATNVVLPLVSVITTVAMDHMEHLGPTLGAIAFEKAGIIKPGVPVVSGVESPTARAVIRRRAATLGAPFVDAFGRGTSFVGRKTRRGHVFVYRIGGDTFRLAPGLSGAHQGRNAAVAAAAIRALEGVWQPIGRAAVESGIRETAWEGRLETYGRRPRLLLDGAHNEAGAEALAAYLREFFPRPPVLVFSMMKDKALARTARKLFPAVGAIILTTIPFRRAAAPEEILEKARAFASKIVIEPDLGAALTLARRLAGPTGTVVVSGSLFLVGEVKKRGRRL